jgi:hypothetical protein
VVTLPEKGESEGKIFWQAEVSIAFYQGRARRNEGGDRFLGEPFLAGGLGEENLPLGKRGVHGVRSVGAGRGVF